MKILGIESSCDETGVAIVEDGYKLLSNEVASSMDLHALYGGVVPEIAARSHLEFMTPAIENALKNGNLTGNDPWDNIDGIAVTYGAGLGGSLLVGVLTARTLAIVKNKPLYAINHVEGHVYANFLTSVGTSTPASLQNTELRDDSLFETVLRAPLLTHSSNTTIPSVTRSRLVSKQSPTNVKQWKLGNQNYVLPNTQPKFPLLALIVSGGHTQLVLFYNHFKYKLLGRTQDDAIGEAFDKVAKIIGLPYPGGPSIAKAAQSGENNKYKFPKAKLDSKYNFSFSGVKTAVLRTAQQICGKSYDFPSHEIPSLLSTQQRNDLAASFEKIAVETVVEKTITAFKEYSPKSVVIAGGVAANQELRKQLSNSLSIEIKYTDPKLCTDNGAMIATLGCFKVMNKQAKADPYTLDIEPNLSM